MDPDNAATVVLDNRIGSGTLRIGNVRTCRIPWWLVDSLIALADMPSLAD